MPTTLNLAAILEENARRDPAKPAVVLGDTRVAYGELNVLAGRIAAGLRAAGLVAGDRVALTCPNVPWFTAVYMGILRAGCVVVPLNVLLKSREIAYHLEDAGASAYFCYEAMFKEGQAGFDAVGGCRRLVAITGDPAAPSPAEGVPTLGQFLGAQPEPLPLTPTQPQDPAVILYTSGTTGMPKGATLTHFNLLMNAQLTRELAGYTREDVTLVVLPLFHSFGQTVQQNAALLAGATLVLQPVFNPKTALGLMDREGVTIFCAVPTMYWALLSLKQTGEADLDRVAANLKVCISGGAAMPVEVLKGFEERFQVPILEGYGLSETSPVACFNQLHQPRKVGSIGTPVWGVEMGIMDEAGNLLGADEPGEVVLRGHNIMAGYHNRPEETEAAFAHGWFHSGDIGKRDAEGYYYILDRSKDMIVRGGFNVYPRELEEVLLTHPDVAMAAVIGVPDDRYGEEVKAFVVPKPDHALDVDALAKWCRQNMASYKYPRQFEVRESLPMTATGKILKRALRSGPPTDR